MRACVPPDAPDRCAFGDRSASPAASSVPRWTSIQRGYRGLGMDQIVNPRRLEDKLAAEQDPGPAADRRPGRHAGPEVYENVKVLGDLDSRRVHPADGRDHGLGGAAAGLHLLPRRGRATSPPTRSTPRWWRGGCSRWSRNINGDWQTHVHGHRRHLLHLPPRPARARRMSGSTIRAAAARPACSATMRARTTRSAGPATRSLPYDPFTPFLEQDNNIRVVADDGRCPAPTTSRSSRPSGPTRLMIHFSTSLGVNCTYCHNSRASSPGTRAPAALHRLVRHPDGARRQQRLPQLRCTGSSRPTGWACSGTWAESGVKRNIPGPCGKAPAVNGNSGWGDAGRDASGVGGEGAAGRAQGRGAEPAGDRGPARPGGLDGQPRAAPQRAAQGRLPAGPRRGLLPRAAAAPGRSRA